MSVFNLQLEAVLAKVDDWQFDSFGLCTAANGRPLSALGFFLLKRSNLMQRVSCPVQYLIDHWSGILCHSMSQCHTVLYLIAGTFLDLHHHPTESLMCCRWATVGSG